MVLLDTETPGTSREIYSEDADGETVVRKKNIKMKKKYIMKIVLNYNGLHYKPFKYKKVLHKIFLNCNGFHCKPFKYKKVLSKIFFNCKGLLWQTIQIQKVLNKIFLNCHGLHCKPFKYKKSTEQDFSCR